MKRPCICLCFAFLLLGACAPKPPSERKSTALAPPETGDLTRGKTLYEEHCFKCHKLTAGSNKKGPQLLGVYGAPAAELMDYNYSAILKTSGVVWNAKRLSDYMENPQAMLPDSRMRTDGIASPTDRQDIIAYLASL